MILDGSDGRCLRNRSQLTSKRVKMFRLQLILSISRSRTCPLLALFGFAFGFVPFVPNKSRQRSTRPGSNTVRDRFDLSPVRNSIEPKLRFLS